ncbi:MAG: DUF4157 domain-containing protein [Symploca sp. SIO2E9]|nr:DUF4157 domain-containing protein [Symploca sp. SIO2E9]
MGNLRLSQTKKILAPAQSQASATPKPNIHPIEELQGIIGNQALGNLIKYQRQNSLSEAGYKQQVHRSVDPLLNSVSPVSGFSIQRQPRFRGLSHELRGCCSENNLVQAKLTIGKAGDKYEQEADQVASEVVRQINAPAPNLSTQPESIQLQHQQDELMRKPMLQLQSVEGGMAATPELESSIQQARGSGVPLTQSIRKPMEQSFGADFSGVRVHTDSQSDQLNQSIQARAFTTGKDIFFQQGEYNPQSRGGQELIAHELTHVIQQNRSVVHRQVDKPDLAISPISKTQTLQCNGRKRKTTSEEDGSSGSKRRAYAEQQSGIGTVIIVEKYKEKENELTKEKKFQGISADSDLKSSRATAKPINVLSLKEIENIFQAIEEGDVNKTDNSIEILLADAEGLKTKWHCYKKDNQTLTKSEIISQLEGREWGLIQEPQGRSGISRAEDTTGLRGDEGAAYQAAKRNINKDNYHDNKILNRGNSEFKHTKNGKNIKNKIVHKGPWEKGERKPSQIDVMGHQNAKNYIEQQEGKRPPGKFEWLHLIGSSLGGPNLLGNLVAGSYDANTEMIPLEHRIALWTKSEDAPTPANPVVIEATAEVTEEDNWIAKKITLKGENKAKGKTIERTYTDARRRNVITKDEYKKLESSIEKELK